MQIYLDPNVKRVSYFSEFLKCIVIRLTKDDIGYALCSGEGGARYKIKCAYNKGACINGEGSNELMNKSKAWNGNGCDYKTMGFIKIQSHYLVIYSKRHGLL